MIRLVISYTFPIRPKAPYNIEIHLLGLLVIPRWSQWSTTWGLFYTHVAEGSETKLQMIIKIRVSRGHAHDQDKKYSHLFLHRSRVYIVRFFRKNPTIQLKHVVNWCRALVGFYSNMRQGVFNVVVFNIHSRYERPLVADVDWHTYFAPVWLTY